MEMRDGQELYRLLEHFHLIVELSNGWDFMRRAYMHWIFTSDIFPGSSPPQQSGVHRLLPR